MRKIKNFAVSVFFLLLSFTLGGCGNNTEQTKETLRKVGVTQISDNNYQNNFTVSGNIIPVETVNLSFKLDGKLADIIVEEGDMVQSGEKIAVLNSNDYTLQSTAAQAELQMSQAGISAAKSQYDAAVAEYQAAKTQAAEEVPSKIKQAEAQLTLTQTTYERIKTLFEGGALPKSELDEISAKLTSDKETYQQALSAKNVADLQLKATEQTVDAYASQISSSSAQTQKAAAAALKASNDVNDTVLKSPISGVVLKKIMSTGETVSAGYPVTSIGKIDSVYIEIGVSAQEINLLKKGQPAQVAVYGMDTALNGTVAEISSLADDNTRTFPVKILLENKDYFLKPGMIAKVTLKISSFQTVAIPLDAVIQRSENSVVYVYQPNNNKVLEKTVTTKEIIGDKIEISSGLEKGDYIVTRGQFLLHNGETVQLEEEDEE